MSKAESNHSPIENKNGESYDFYTPLESELKKIYDFAMELVKAENEEAIIQILTKYGYWDDMSVWFDYGGKENNYSIIGNQQHDPLNSLLEKLINAIDAILMYECLKLGIDPRGPFAPKSICQAVQTFFGINNGDLAQAAPELLSSLQKRIALVATGSKKGNKKQTCYAIIDNGEGQSPKRFSKTFLSLCESNKLQIPFVQGQFNQGGSGVLRFAGRNGIEVIISKRAPELAKLESGDETAEYWGVTVTRRMDLGKGQKNSTFRYLAPVGKILMFKAPSIPVLPGSYPNAYGEPMKWGTYIKVYNYDIPGLKTVITLDPREKINASLPKVALPIRLYERREGYAGHTLDSIIDGLSVRIKANHKNWIENGFPITSSITMENQTLQIEIFAFQKKPPNPDPKKQEKQYATKLLGNERILFVLNGQTQGTLDRRILSREEVGLDYLKDYIAIFIDVSHLSNQMREDLFMASRDRLSKGKLYQGVEKLIIQALKINKPLQELRDRRRSEEIKNQAANKEDILQAFKTVLSSNPLLSALFLEGNELPSEINSEVKPVEKIKNGITVKLFGNKLVLNRGENISLKQFPTLCNLSKDIDHKNPKEVLLQQKFVKIKILLDAKDDYFHRDPVAGRGTLKICKQDNSEIKNYSLDFRNGIAVLSFERPQALKNLSSTSNYIIEINDRTRLSPFLLSVYIKLKPGSDKKPGGGTHGQNRQRENRLGKINGRINVMQPPIPKFQLPEITPVYKSDWGNHDFDESSALKIRVNGNKGYDFFINMDNKFLKKQCESKIDAPLIQEQYKIASVLLALSILNQFKHTQNSNTEDLPCELTSKIMIGVAPIILPIICGFPKIKPKAINSE